MNCSGAGKMLSDQVWARFAQGVLERARAHRTRRRKAFRNKAACRRIHYPPSMRLLAAAAPSPQQVPLPRWV